METVIGVFVCFEGISTVSGHIQRLQNLLFISQNGWTCQENGYCVTVNGQHHPSPELHFIAQLSYIRGAVGVIAATCVTGSPTGSL